MTNKKLKKLTEEISRIIEENDVLQDEINELIAENEMLKSQVKEMEINEEELEYSNLLSLTDTAKVLKIKPQFFVNFLVVNGYVFRNGEGYIRPYQECIDREFLSFVECWKNGRLVVQTLTTPFGREYFKELYEIGEFNAGLTGGAY